MSAGLLHSIYGVQAVAVNGEPLVPVRRTLNFVGSNVSVVDNPAEDRADITILGASTPPAILPDGYDSIRWQPNLLLLPDFTGISYDDRSGNNYDGGTGNPNALPGNVPNTACLNGSSGNPMGFTIGTVYAPLRTLGAMTFFAVIATPGYWPGGAAGVIGECSNRGNAAAAGNASWSLKCGKDPGSSLAYFAERGTHTAINFDGTGTLPDLHDGRFHFVSLRRNVAGTVVTLGVDGVYVTSGTLLAPQSGSDGRGCIGLTAFDPAVFHSHAFEGMIVQAGFWDAFKTDDDLDAIETIVMGT